MLTLPVSPFLQLKASLESMQTSKEGLESELNQELLATLSSRDQHEVDSLNDDIRRLKQENKMAFAERMRLEAQKNSHLVDFGTKGEQLF